MRYFFILIACLSSAFATAADTFSQDRLTAFYEEYLDEEKLVLYNAHLTSAPTTPTPSPAPSPLPPPPTPPPPPPTPPTNPLNPAPITGYLPVVISNTTGQPDDQIYVILAGQQTPSNLTQYYFQLGENGIAIRCLTKYVT